MATITATARKPAPPGILTHRAVRKLLILALAAAILAPIAATQWSGATWPSALTVDVSEPSARPATGSSTTATPTPVPLLLRPRQQHRRHRRTRRVPRPPRRRLGRGHRDRRPGRLAGGRRRLAAGTAAAFLACGLLGMWVPTMQTLALMVVAVLASVAVGALLGLASRPVRPDGPRPAPGARHHAGAARLRLPPPRRPGLRHRRPRRRAGHRRLRRPAHGPAHLAGPARRGPGGPGGRRVPRHHRPPAPADRPHPLGPQGTPPRRQPDDHDGAVHGRHRLGHRRRMASATASTRPSPRSTSARPSRPASRSCCSPSSWTG